MNQTLYNFSKIFKFLRIIIFNFDLSKKIISFLLNSVLSKPEVYQKKIGNNFIYKVKNDTLINHEPEFEKLISLILKPNSNCLDLGGHIGIHSIIMSRVVTRGKVFVIEPNGLLFSLIQLNILKNKIKNIIAYNFFALSKTGRYHSLTDLDFNSKTLNTGVSYVNHEFNTNIGSLSIKVDDLNLPKIDFIKIDIQGSEFAALNGSIKVINKDRPIIFIEVEEYYLNKMKTNSQKLINFFKMKNFFIYQIQTDYPINHICVPKENDNLFKKKIFKKFPYNLRKL